MEILLICVVSFWAIALADASFGMRKIKALEKQHVTNKANERLTVIVAARNEERAIRNSLLSQFNQTYENVEWIVVNDRSTDATKDILIELEKSESRLSVIHIEELPSGWLGKNHALYRGYQEANGNVLLFTDADIIFQPQAFEKAINYLIQNDIDHMTLAPYLKVKGFWLQAFIAFFLFGFNFFKRPWRANMKRSKHGIGIGAFNLLTKKAYEAIGTHKSLSLSPDDDLQLGIKVKKIGLTQEFATALTLIEVNWYESLQAAIQGLEKNAFAGLYYRLSMVFVAVIGTFLSHTLPFFLLLVGSQSVRIYSGIAIILMFILYKLVTKKMTLLSGIHFLVFPLTALIFVFTIVRATYLTYKQGGVYWRGTFYPLAELRKGTK